MSKLPEQSRFVDVSDYGRPMARAVVRRLVETRVSSVHLTLLFFVAGLAAAALIVAGHVVWASLFLLLKNVLDAADGEMARARARPSHTGRYLDSVFDFAINLLVLGAIFHVSGGPAWMLVAAFLSVELQGTIFNYYYLVQRAICSGDPTSRINEFARPVAFPYESQRVVDALHAAYLACYGLFDQLMLRIDRGALGDTPLPSWFMTLVSTMGLGFQILLIVLFLVSGNVGHVLTFFVAYTGWGAAIVLIRKLFVRQRVVRLVAVPVRIGGGRVAP
jgi:hypothetical protein